MVKLYTTDTTDLTTVAQNADLYPYESDEAATADLGQTYTDFKIVGWRSADFADCWLKLYNEPELDDDGYAEIDGIKCLVGHPGSHPGGRSWWLSPVLDVMVPVFEAIEE